MIHSILVSNYKIANLSTNLLTYYKLLLLKVKKIKFIKSQFKRQFILNYLILPPFTFYQYKQNPFIYKPKSSPMTKPKTQSFDKPNKKKITK